MGQSVGTTNHIIVGSHFQQLKERFCFCRVFGRGSRWERLTLWCCQLFPMTDISMKVFSESLDGAVIGNDWPKAWKFYGSLWMRQSLVRTDLVHEVSYSQWLTWAWKFWGGGRGSLDGAVIEDDWPNALKFLGKSLDGAVIGSDWHGTWSHLFLMTNPMIYRPRDSVDRSIVRNNWPFFQVRFQHGHSIGNALRWPNWVNFEN